MIRLTKLLALIIKNLNVYQKLQRSPIPVLNNTWKNYAYATGNIYNIPYFNIRYNLFKNSFFPFTIIEWNNLDLTLWNSKNFGVFENSILKFIRPCLVVFLLFNCDNYKGIRLFTKLHVGLNHLREHKFKCSLKNCLNPISSCGLDIEKTSHFLFHCPNSVMKGISSWSPWIKLITKY